MRRVDIKALLYWLRQQLDRGLLSPAEYAQEIKNCTRLWKEAAT